MAGSIKHRTVVVLPNTGAAVSTNGWNDSLVMGGGSDGQVATRDSTQPDGWKFATASSFTPPADSVSVAQASASAGDTNLSTVGTIDWLFMGGTTTIPRQVTSGAQHSKIRGGWLMDSFDWIYGGVTPTLFGTTTTITATSTVADDIGNAALSVNNGVCGLFTNPGAPYGFRLRVPAVAQARKLVLTAGTFSCDATCTATIRGQAEVVASQLISGGVSAGRADVFTILFTAPLGGELLVDFKLTNVLGAGTGPNVTFNHAYITTP